MNPKIIALAVAFALVCINSLGGSPGAQMPRLAQAVPSTQPLPLPPPQPGGTGFGQDVIPGQGDPHKPGFDPKAVPFHDFHPEFSPGPGSRQSRNVTDRVTLAGLGESTDPAHAAKSRERWQLS